MNYGTRMPDEGELAMNANHHALRAMQLQAIWDAEDEEEFQRLVNPSTNQSASLCSTGSGTTPADEVSPAEIPPDFSEESPSTQVQNNYSCRMVVHDVVGSFQHATTSSAVNSLSPRDDADHGSADHSARLHCTPQIGVHFPEAMTVSSVTNAVNRGSNPDNMSTIGKVLEEAFTPNVEELLDALQGSLEVVHQVAPAEVKRHLEKWRPPAQTEVDSMENMNAIIRHRGQAAKALLSQPGVEVIPAKGVFTVKPGKPFLRVVSCGNFARSVAEEVLYASGAAAETLRAILVHAGLRRRQCWSTDIKCAFLLAPIPDTVQKKYVLKPPAILVALEICKPDEY